MDDTVGFESWTEDGRPQVNSTYGVWGLVSVGSTTLYDDGMTHPQPLVRATVTITGSAPIIAIRPVGTAAVGLEYSNKVGNTFTFSFISQSSSPVTINWWVFDNTDAAMIDASMDDVGGRVYNTYGQKVFDASMSMLRPITALAPTGRNTSSYTIPSGKSYAVAFSGLSLYRANLDTGNYSNSATRPDIIESPIEEGEPPTTANWRQQELWGELGMVSFNGNTISAGMTRFERYTDWYPFSSLPREDLYGNMGFTIVDVTDFVGGGGTSPGTITVSANATLREVTISSAGDSVTPAVTISISGSSGTSDITWLKRSGSSSVVANGATNTTTFNTKVIGQAAGTTVESVWYARVIRGGITGYSPDITFRHIAGATDTTPDTITAFNLLQVQSNDPDVAWSTSPRQITGINAPIALRVERYDYVGNLSALYVDVFTGPSSSGPWTSQGFFTASNGGLQYLDFTVTNGTWFYYSPHAVTASGMKSASVRFTVWNLSAPGGSAVLSNVANNTFKVDADDNYNIAPDYTPNALNWANINFVTTSDAGAGTNPSLTISGTNQAITVRATITSISTNFSTGNLYIFKNGSNVANASGLGSGYWAATNVSSGDSLYFYVDGSTTSGRRTLSATVEVRNMTTDTVLDTFTVSGVVDDDDNFNVAPTPDYTPNPISLSDQTMVTDDWEGYTAGTYFQITGINQPITIRISRGTSTDNMPNGGTRRMVIGKSTNGGASYAETNMGAASAPLDFTANNGDWFFLKGYFNTVAGRASSSWPFTVTNATMGTTLGTATITGTVDNDDNYNVSTPPPIVVSISNPYSSIYNFANAGLNRSVSAAPGVSFTGGVGPFTYSWVRTSGPTLSGATNTLNPTFSYTATTNWAIFAEYGLTITDAIGQKGYASFIADWGAGNTLG